MFSKLSVVAAMLVTTLMATVAFQIQEGLGDDTERSVLVRPDSSASDAPATRYAEPRAFEGAAPVRQPGASSAQGSVGDSTSRYNTDPPRTASRSSLVDRLKNVRRDDGTPNTQAPSSSTPSASTAKPVVPFRRPGGLRNRPTTPQAPAGNAAPPVEMQQTVEPRTTRRPLTDTPRTTTPPSRVIENDRMPAKVGEPSVIMRSPGPVVILDAVGPQAIQLGKPATFVVRATNAGSMPAQEIIVRVEVPGSAQLLGNQPTIGESQVVDNGDGTVRVEWRIDEMAPQGQERLELTLMAQDRSPLALKMEWTTRPRQAMAQIEVQEPQLDVNVVGPRTVLFGQTEVYTVTVSNPGTGPAENVVLDVALGGGPSESKRIGVIAPGGREVIKLELTAGDAGEMPILAAVRGDGGLKHEFEHRVIVRRAKLEIAVDGPGLKYAGTAATYAVTIRNNGDAPAEAVEAVVQLPSGAKYLGGLTGAEQKLQKLGWRIGTLQPGDERSYKVRCDLTTAGENRFNAVTSSADQNQAATVFVTRVESIADLKLFVNDPQGPQAVGEEVEYEITILNRGTKSASNVNVIAHFADGVEPTGAEGLAFEMGDGQVLFKAIPRVSPGQEIVLKVRARAARGGDHRFRAEVQCDEPNTKLSAEETTRYFGEPAATTARRP